MVQGNRLYFVFIVVAGGIRIEVCASLYPGFFDVGIAWREPMAGNRQPPAKPSAKSQDLTDQPCLAFHSVVFFFWACA